MMKVKQLGYKSPGKNFQHSGEVSCADMKGGGAKREDQSSRETNILWAGRSTKPPRHRDHRGTAEEREQMK